MPASATDDAIITVWKNESVRVVAVLARIVRDVGLAEELAQDALIAALEQWPRSGVPDRPAAWLMTTAKNRALNAARRELQASRAPARTDANGEPILLLDQDRSMWDADLRASGLAMLARADANADPRGPYRLQAALAACHARAETAEDTDWKRIAALYGELEHVVPSPVIALNRAVAISRAEGPAAGLALLDALATEPALTRYHLLPSARADLLEKLGRHAEARAEFERAASLAENERQRARLLARAATCGGAAILRD